MPGLCEDNMVAGTAANPEYWLTNPSALADSKMKR